MSSTAAVKRKKMKHYSVGSIIWIIVEYASLIFFGFCAIIPIVSCITTAFKMPSTRIPMLWHSREAG